MSMQTIREFVIEDMERRMMSYREYAEFLGVTHPTVARYINEEKKSMQWDFLVKLSGATKTDIGFLARLAAPEVAFEDVPDATIITQRINQLPSIYRKTIIEMVNALLAQQQRPKHGE